MRNERSPEQKSARPKRRARKASRGRPGIGAPPARLEREATAIDDRARQFQLLVSGVSDYAIYMLDPDGIVVSWNTGAERIKGYTEAEIVGKSFATFYTEADRRAGAPARSLRKAREEGRFEAEAQRVRKDGSLFWADVVIDAIRDESGHLIGFAKITRDITERRGAQDQLRRLANFDPLTGLPNRGTVMEKFDELIGEGTPVAILMMDLDGFKDTNDSYGHVAGDAILCAAAARIRACIDDRGVVGRWGGDEFTAFLPGVADIGEAERIARDLIDAFEPLFAWNEHEIQLGVSIGIAFALEGGARDEFLANADLALYRAKADGRNRLSFYEPKLREESLARKKLESELRKAMGNGEFEVFFQPQVSLEDGRVVGAEALLRWHHPTRGFLTPAAFISTLREASSAHIVGDWIISEACRLSARARAAGFDGFRVAVNVFGAQFRRGRLVSATLGALRETRMPADAIAIEITEDIILRHDAEMIQPLQMLQSLGVGIAFDDYGTGYASLSQLKRFPLSTLKIDRSFVRGLCSDGQDKSVVKAIIYLGRSFGLDVIAEGIEAEEQAEMLRRFECAKGQGYLFGRPMPADRFMDWLEGQAPKQAQRAALGGRAG